MNFADTGEKSADFGTSSNLKKKNSCKLEESPFTRRYFHSSSACCIQGGTASTLGYQNI